MFDDEKSKEQLLMEISYLKQVVLEWQAKCSSIEDFARSTQERFLNITSAVSDYIFSVHVVDGSPVETVHGPACYAITGYTPMEFYENTYLWINMVYPEDRAAVLDHVAKILSGKEVKPLEHRIIRKDGVIRWVRNTPVCQYDSEGKLRNYDGLIQDITEIKRAFDTLRLSEEKFSKAFRSSPDIISITTVAEGRFLDVNDAFTRGSGYSREEVIGRTVKELGIWVIPEERQDMIGDLLKTGSVTNKEVKIRTKSGEIHTMLSSAELIVMGDEQCMILVARDITKSKKVFSDLQQYKQVLEENLKLERSRSGCLTELLLEEAKRSALSELILLGIDYESIKDKSFSAQFKTFIDVLNIRLPAGLEVKCALENLPDIESSNEPEQRTAIFTVLFRIVELITALNPDSMYSSLFARLELRDKYICIVFEADTQSSQLDSTGNLTSQFSGAYINRHSMEYMIGLFIKKVLAGNLFSTLEGGMFTYNVMIPASEGAQLQQDISSV